MGMLLFKLQRLDEAEALLREALERTQRVLGPDHPLTLTTMNNLGSLLLAREQLDEAERLLRQAVVGRRRVLGDAHPQTLTAMEKLSRVLRDKGNRVEAETLLLEAERALSSNPASGIAHAKCVVALVELYTAWDHAEPGKGYDAKAQQWSTKLPASRPASTRSSD
jgi:tetratricopeptide (TPR) repeat protein